MLYLHHREFQKNILFFLPLLLAAKGSNVEFVTNYFLDRHVPHIAMFTCWNVAEHAAFSFKLKSSNLRVSYVPHEDVDLQRFLVVNYYKLGIVFDLDCLKNENILHQISEQPRFFNESYFWLMTSNYEVPTKVLSKLPLSINAELTVAVRHLDSYELFDVYNPSYRHGGKLNVTYLGEWNQKDVFRLALNQYKYDRRGNLHGMYLNFSVALDYQPKSVDLVTYLTTPMERHLDSMHRYQYSLIVQLRDCFNFTINLSRGTTWGYLVNGTFTGIVGDMIKGIVDISATPMQYKPERLDVIEYVTETWLARPTIIFRHPKNNALNNNFFKPLDVKVWWISGMLALLSWFALYISVKIERKMLTDDTYILNNSFKKQPASNTFLITTSAICQQGLNEGPRLYSGRIVFISLFFWTMIVYQFYSASIVGSLLAPTPRFIKTLKDISDSNLEVGIEDIAYNHDFFQTTTDPVAIELYHRKIAPAKKKTMLPYFTPAAGLRQVQKGGFAFQVDIAMAYKIITDTFAENEICELEEIQLFAPKSLSIVAQRHSPFKKMITYGVRQIKERGMSNRMRHVWHHPRPRCPENHNSLPTPVPFNEFSPVLVMLAVGTAMGLFVMFIEYLIRFQLIRQLICFQYF